MLHWRGGGLLGIGAAVLLGCQSPTFVCQSDVNCGESGRCEPEGHCSFPDATCPSGRRYGAASAKEFAGRCVDPGGQTTSSGVGPPGTGDTGTAVGPTGGHTTLAVDESTTLVATSAGAATGTTDGIVDTTGDVALLFLDEFDRPDSAGLGNGWLEANPALFSIAGQRVNVDDSSAMAFWNNMATRPNAEAVLDATVSVEFSVSSAASHGAPQVHARASIDRFGALSSYVCFWGVDSLLLWRVQENAETELAAEIFSDHQVGVRYRLRLTVTDGRPVFLECALQSQSDGAWTDLAFVNADDGDPEAIEVEGVVGFSVNTAPQPLSYDNFRMAAP